MYYDDQICICCSAFQMIPLLNDSWFTFVYSPMSINTRTVFIYWAHKLLTRIDENYKKKKEKERIRKVRKNVQIEKNPTWNDELTEILAKNPYMNYWNSSNSDNHRFAIMSITHQLLLSSIIWAIPKRSSVHLFNFNIHFS